MVTSEPVLRFNQRVRAALADHAQHYHIPATAAELADRPKPEWLLQAIKEGIIIAKSMAAVEAPELDCFALSTDSRRQWVIPGEYIVRFPSGALLLITGHAYEVFTNTDNDEVVTA